MEKADRIIELLEEIKDAIYNNSNTDLLFSIRDSLKNTE